MARVTHHQTDYPSPRPRGRLTLALSLSSAILGVALFGCVPTAQMPPTPPNILLIVADTLRADALSCYGGPTSTPSICSLARDGVQFERAYSAGGWTLPASVTLFTGQHATVFARDDGQKRPANRFYLVPPSEVLLAEILKSLSYQTAAFVESGVAIKPRSLQGFERREVNRPDVLAERHTEWARERNLPLDDFRDLQVVPMLRFLGEEVTGPFFALQWFKDPHAIYAPPTPWMEGLRARFSNLPHSLDHYTRLAARDDPTRGWIDFEARVADMSTRELDAVRALYHAEVESLDARVGSILKALDEGGLRENTFVIFTSDHGEGFGEHGKFFHADRWLYEEFVRIPLLISGPGISRGQRIDAAVSHIDLVPTLRVLLGLSPASSDQGQSLHALLHGQSDQAKRVQYLVATARDDGFAALVDGRYKLILRPQSAELFDLVADPGETRDLAAEQPDVVERMRARADALHAEDRARRSRRLAAIDEGTVRQVGAETLRELQALGYLETGDLDGENPPPMEPEP
ncbi:sulfatase-like hydrolase/transferase [Myxococcota bacterium]|nr:sulfatase-like hydrolase/transferase [Myxococcota bacterium]